MGLLSFIAVAQCAPAILLGLYWRRGNRAGAYAGISAGFFVWFYTLIIPALGKEEILGPVVPVERAARPVAAAPHRVPRAGRARHHQPRGVLVLLLQRGRRSCWCRCSPSRTRTTGPRPPPSWGSRARTSPRRGRPRSCPRPRSSGSSITTSGRRGRGGHRARAVRGQGPRRPVGARAARDAHPLRAAPRRLPGRGGRAHHRGGPLHDLQGGGPAARHLVPAHAAVPAGHRGGGQARASGCSPRWSRAWTTASSPPTPPGAS